MFNNFYFIDASGNPVTQSAVSVTDSSGNPVTGKFSTLKEISLTPICLFWKINIHIQTSF